MKRLFLACVFAGLMVLGLTVVVARADGPIIDLDQNDEDFRVVGEDALDYLGEMATGDINADGIPDLIIGASGYDVTGTSVLTNAGAVYVIFGASDLSGTLDLNGSGGDADLMIQGVVAHGYAGHTVASGDIDGDGFADIIVGADVVTHTGRIGVGAVYVITGPITQALTSPIPLSDTSRVALTVYGEGNNDYDRFGRAVAAGDVNGDMVDDLIVGSYGTDGPHGSDSGRAYVFYGGTGLSGTLDMSIDDPDVQIIGDDAYDYLGRSLTVGDVNGDGVGDLILGSYQAGTGILPGSGEVVLIYGSDSLSQTIDLHSHNIVQSGLGLRLHGLDMPGGTGFYVAAGNINGDENPGNGFGYADILVGAYLETHNEDGKGYAIYGGPEITTGATITPGTWTVSMSGCVDVILYPADAGDRLGRSASSGDLNDDGYDDFIIGASRGDPGPGRSNAGETYVFYGGLNISPTININPTGNTNMTVLGDDFNDESGRSSASGDVNGDGVDDLIVGAVMAGSGLGEVYVIWGSKVASITVEPSMDTVVANQPVSFTVTAWNTYGQSWDVSVYSTTFDITPGAGGSWNQNVYTTTTAGTWVVTATHKGLTATTTFTVTPANAVDVALVPDDATREAGQDVVYTVVATDTYGNGWDATATAGYTITSGAGGTWATNVYTSELSGGWTVTATVDGVDGTAVLTVTHADAASVSLTPAAVTREAGQDVAYTTMAMDSYGNGWDATATAGYTITSGAGGTWTSNVYTSELAGVWTVTATVDGVDDTAMLTVYHAGAVGLTLDPATATYEAGQDVTYTAEAMDLYGNSWDATAETVYAITLGAGGGWTDNVYSAEIAGLWTVTGTLGVVDDTAELTVTHASVVSVELDPATATREAGQDVTYTSTATDAYGNSWDVTATATYTITPGAGGSWTDNVYTGEFAGVWTVTATVGSLDDTAELTLTHANAADVALTPASETREAGQDVTYSVAATDVYGNNWDATAEAMCAITPGAGGSWASNVYTTEFAGTWTVTGTVDGVDDTAMLTVKHAGAVGLTLDPATATREAGQDVTYTAEAMDTYGNSWDVTAETVYAITLGAGESWTDNVYVTEIAGTWTVTGTLAGSLGVVYDTVELTVTHASAVSMMLTPATATREAGQDIAYTATATDTYGNSWDAMAVYTITPGAGGSWTDNVYTAEFVGVWTVTAMVDSLDDTAELTVTHASAASVALAPATAERMAGASITYTSTATDTYGNSWDATATAVYTITPGAGGSWADNVYTAEFVGVWTVTATVDGEDGTAELTVSHAALDRVNLTPESDTLVAGESVTYTLTAYDVYDNAWDVTADGAYAITSGAGGSWTDNVYVGGVAGTWTVTGTYNAEQDTATLVVTIGPVDHIVIEDATGGTGSEVLTHSMEAGAQFTVWAAGYDAGGNYVGDVTVTWSGTGVAAGQLSPTSGVSTTLTPATDGTATIHADDGSGHTDDTGTITVIVTTFKLLVPLVMS